MVKGPVHMSVDYPSSSATENLFFPGPLNDLAVGKPPGMKQRFSD